MVCLFCDDKERFEKYKIKEYAHWEVYLSLNQCYLGRCIVPLKRHLEDFFDISEEELKEFFGITRNLRDVLKKVFGADMLNYATLGNNVRHVHLHVIPRYSKKVEFSGIIFEDKRWGKNYAPCDESFEIPDEIKEAIIDKIKSNIDKIKSNL